MSPASDRGTDQLAGYSSAILNILDDFAAEKVRLAETQKAILNILEDFSSERMRLSETQKAVLNILEDLESEKGKVEATNHELGREVAERRRAEVALLQKTQELARSNAELEQFAYVASHDLQEPLRAVAGCVQLLQQRYEGQLDGRADEFIHHAIDGAARMRDLINDLLAYSRVESRGHTLAPTDAAAALKEALENLLVSVRESSAQITSDPLPMVVADHVQLVQLLQNLVSNSIKFRADRPVVIHIGVEYKSGEWLFSVRDNGIGIESQYAERIFRVFQRLHTRREYPGTGIGLAICKKIVERHGGRIWVTSDGDHGSTFYFTLPDRRDVS